MSPHAISVPSDSESDNGSIMAQTGSYQENGHQPNGYGMMNGHQVNGTQSNGHHQTNGQQTNGHQMNGHNHPETTSLLPPTSDDEIHDLICVGFGPASLAIAVALNDALESPNTSNGLKTSAPKVRFLERQPRFAWHAGMLLPGAKMQITFIKDLATLRNPRSNFTFLNYLFLKNRLVQFTNLSTFLPQRIEYEAYMRWCADHFSSNVSYAQNVQSIIPGPTNPQTGKVDHFTLTSTHTSTGQTTTLTARNIVIATGGAPSLPPALSSSPQHPRILHSSQYATSLPSLFPPTSTPPKRIAVIGAGQSAAEIFSNLPSHFPLFDPKTGEGMKVHLIIRGPALKPSDDSPFVNEIFDPDRVDAFYKDDAERRAEGLRRDRGTNYGVVRPELLERIYEGMYEQRVSHGDDEEGWGQRILHSKDVTGFESLGGKGQGVKLRLRGLAGEAEGEEELLDVDLAVVASGYRRDAHEGMLEVSRHLMPAGGKEGERWEVGRDYKVKTQKGAMGAEAGLWLQGCNEGTHGLSDTLLSILATRGGEMVNSIFGAGPDANGTANGH